MKKAKMSGILDWFKPKKKEESKGIIYIGPGGEAKTSLPARTPAEAPLTPFRPKETLQDKLLSLFTVFDPKTPNLPTIAEKLDILPGEAAPKAPQEMTVRSEEVQKEVWKELFEESQEEPTATLFEIFEPSKEEAQEERGLAPMVPVPGRPEHADWVTGQPPLYWHTKWRLPSKFATAYWVQNHPDRFDLPALFEYVLQNTDYPGWKRMVEESAHFGEPAILEVDEVAHWSNAYEELANFLEIPQQVIDAYFSEVRGIEDAEERSHLFQIEVLEPYLENIGLALDALKPPILRGWFEISPADDMSWWLKYQEAKFRA